MSTKGERKMLSKEVQEMHSQTLLQQTIINELRDEKEKSLSNQKGSTEQNGELHYLIQHGAPMESSKGQLRSKLLSGYDLPEAWPVYEWPKEWAGAQQVVGALLALKDLQSNYTLKEAIRNLKSNCKRLNRSLFPNEWRIIQPFIDGIDSPHEHDVWEICLTGDGTCEPHIASWLYACRTVKPALIAAGGYFAFGHLFFVNHSLGRRLFVKNKNKILYL